MFRYFLPLILITACSSCQLDIVKTDYGVGRGIFLTIKAPAGVKNPALSGEYISNNSSMIDAVLFKGDQGWKIYDYVNGYTDYPAGFLLDGKKYISISNTIILQRQYNGKSDFNLFLTCKKNSEPGNIQYILEYSGIKDKIHSELLVYSSGSYYKNAGQIYTDFARDIYLVASFEYISKYNPDSINGNFQRLLNVQNKPSIDPVSGKMVKSYFAFEGPSSSRADIYLTVYPYQNGTKAVVTAIIYPRENDRTIDFSNDYDIISNQLKNVVND